MPGRRRHRRRGGRRHGLLEPVLLLCLHHGPAHGYLLVERLEKFNLQEVPMTQVYRHLRKMEELGWVSSAWDEEESLGPPRRVYHLTTEGDSALAEWMTHLEEMRARIDHIFEVYQRHLAEGRGPFHDETQESE